MSYDTPEDCLTPQEKEARAKGYAKQKTPPNGHWLELPEDQISPTEDEDEPVEQAAPKATTVEDEVVSVTSKKIRAEQKKAKEAQERAEAERGPVCEFLDWIAIIAYADGDDLKAAIDQAAKKYKKSVAEVTGALTLIRKGIAREQALSSVEGRQKEQRRSAGDGYVLLGHSRKKLVEWESLDERLALLETRNAQSVFVSRADLFPTSSADLARRLADEVICTGTNPKNNEPIYVSAFEHWKGDARRHIFRKIEFTCKPRPADVFNLYKGLGIEPKEGDCSVILNHIKEVICSGDEDAYQSMLKLLAWQIQHIGEPSRIVVILKSERQQTGKGIFLENVMLKIYGPSGFKPSTTDQILGRFNDVIRGRSFLFLDEVLFAGDRKAADAVKRLSTTVEGGIETKGLPIVECPIAVNLWLCSNHKDAAFIEQYDARYWVLDVSEHRIKDSEYFGALGRQIESGGCEAFAHHLIKMDVSDFKPQYDIKINTAAKREMIKQSINAFDARKWLEECCVTGRLIGRGIDYNQGEDENEHERWVHWFPGLILSFSQLAEAYTAWQRRVKAPQAPKPTPIAMLGELLGQCGFGETRTSTQRRRVLPSTETCLAALMSPQPGVIVTSKKDAVS